MNHKLYLYDTEQDCIGTGSLSSAYIKQQLNAAGGADIEVHISSVGGSAFDAIAIYDMLKKYPGKVTTYVDALAASAASIIAMAGQDVVMSKYALLMIHKPMVGSGGNADELLKDVQMLNIVQSRLAQIYMDRSGLDEVTINSFINAVTWMTADQALDLGFIDRVEDYSADIINSAIIRNYTGAAPAVYQRCINKILNTNNKPNNKQTHNNMNMENKDLIEKTASVLDKMMNFFKRVVNKATITDKGTLHHTGEMEPGSEVYQDEDLSKPAPTNLYVTSSGKKVKVKEGKVEELTPGEDVEDEDDDIPTDKLKKGEVTNRIASIRAKLHAQNSLLADARAALEDANARLKKTREEVRNEIKSNFTPEGSRRSNKARSEDQPFFAPQTTLAKNAVRKAVAK
ncbi:head maturation protease, ClpP-related [Mucilaginibacter myungsuensis]|uniref:ATP-dependent Clp protease proteolytic subunit n=1 Tax=Mucilaginibacter myungsuensis TaxID=649104 RepID=A0A929KUW3_9SPHI|nr:head maturation protease, ClpP-related [Mucilaginibacter myungsuensis]MBE9662019.1 Clp protease ClpP [Mucilaginibacter myungsuensis]MDN3599548.1 Clp protease ClpP [Mucilaginibacter myungsuensis]